MKYVFSFLVFLLLLCEQAAFGAGPVATWKGLERELDDATGEGSFQDLLSQNATYRALLEARNVTMFLEMSAQNDFSSVKLAGFFGLCKLNPGLGLEVGLKIALSPDAPKYALVLYPAIKEIHIDKGFNQALTSALRSSPVDVGLMTAVVELLPREQLWSWFHTDKRDLVIPTYQAIILSRLFSEAHQRGRTPTEQMRVALLSYRVIPGMPRLTYAIWADKSAEGYKEIVQQVLEDEQIPYPALLGFLRMKGSYITANINLGSLQISEGRRQKIKVDIKNLDENMPRNEKH